MLKSLFGGRLARVRYACIVVPILLVQQAFPFIVNRAPLVFERFLHASLANIGMYMTLLGLVLAVFPFILLIANIKRLHDIGLTGWLAVPLFAGLFVGFAVGYSKSQSLLTGVPVDPTLQLALTWLSRGIFWYGWILVLALLFIPGRRKPAPSAEPASAF